MNICGIATLITAIVILTREDEELSRENHWLWTIHRYNSFCRAIFIDWFVKEKINISDLLLSKTNEESLESLKRPIDTVPLPAVSLEPKKTEVLVTADDENRNDKRDQTEYDKEEGEANRQSNNAKLNGWHLYMHEHMESNQSNQNFSETSKALKRTWREMESELRLDYNSRAKNGINLDPCEVCKAQFKHLKRRNEHIKSCGKLFECSDCKQSYNTEKALNGHKSAKHSEKFPCETCKKCFESLSKLARHNLSHEKSKTVSCDICGKTFGRRDNMLQHKKNIPNDNF